MIFYQKSFRLSRTFLFFLCCFLCVSAANNMPPHRFRSVNNYFQFFWNFFAVFRQRSIYYHRLLVLSTLFMVLLEVHSIIFLHYEYKQRCLPLSILLNTENLADRSVLLLLYPLFASLPDNAPSLLAPFYRVSLFPQPFHF